MKINRQKEIKIKKEEILVLINKLSAMFSDEIKYETYRFYITGGRRLRKYKK